MAYVYKALSQDDMDDMLVQTIIAQEKDLYSHTLNKERFKNILSDPNCPDHVVGADKQNNQITYKARINGLLSETNNRLSEVENIINHLTPQLPNKPRIDASIARLKIKENASLGITS